MPDSKGELAKEELDGLELEAERTLSGIDADYNIRNESDGKLSMRMDAAFVLRWVQSYRDVLSDRYNAEQRIEELEKLLHEARFRHLLDHYSPTLNEWKKLVDKVLPLFPKEKYV